ncbi:3-hydroxyanthranilate 3,4-dioxygenase [Frankliniella fusca]|uniref:3-hydroxyanthranilate 3,4-dioxygenase n=1 Tax=Frankliniella fusca TaxID=407009 RepID=A0AAE1HY70_9NEOP|nr:3-hydroxyanthranilate 3,4-dioxygenase [Frankliniella fusca]
MSVQESRLYFGESSNDFHTITLPPGNVTCQHCGALFRRTEVARSQEITAMCCDNGKVKLPDGGKFKQPPNHIKALFVENNPVANKFRDAIVSYNRMFAMAFPQGKLQSILARRYSSMVVNGELRFVANSYLSADQQNIAKPGELYFVEMSGDVATARIATSTMANSLDVHLVESIETFLRQENKLFKTFVTSGEKAKAIAENRPVREVILAINPRPAGRTSYRGMWNYYRNYTLDPNFDLPTIEYMGAVFYGELTHGVHHDVRYFIRPRRAGDASDILNRGDKASLDMLTFPLFHLFGEFSRCVKGDPDREFPELCTLRQYYKFRIQIREGEWNPLFRGERLFLQYLITAALRCEYNDVDFHKRPEQHQVYKEAYKSVIEFILDQAQRHDKVINPGGISLLPSHVAHTERNGRNRFLDCMAIMTKFKGSSYFITMTANPKWKEIQEDLPEVPWYFKPQVNVRVFLQKMAVLLNLLVQRQCLGRALGYACVIEYQKRGLPHCHIIMMVYPDDMPKCGREVDLVIRADIPDPAREPQLHELVTRVNLHHLCREKKRRGQEVFCMVDGKHCKSKFPKSFSDETIITGRQVLFKRPENGVVFRNPKSGEVFTISTLLKPCEAMLCITKQMLLQVVPYNPFLSLVMQTNTNIEICSQEAQIVKYVSLYINKSGDQVYTSMAEENLIKGGQHVDWDEIQFYKKKKK